MLKSGLQVLGRVENFILGSTFIVMTAAMTMQVINRGFIKAAMPWLEELSVYCMIWMVMIGLEAGLRDGSQLSITLVHEKLKGRARTTAEIIAKLVVVFFSIIMLWSSWQLVMQQVNSGQTSPALHWPMWVPYLAFLVAFLLVTIVQLITLGLLVMAFIKDDPSIVSIIDEGPEDIHKTIEKETAFWESAAADGQSEGEGTAK